MPLDIRSVFDGGSRDSGHGPAPAGGPALSGDAAAGTGDTAELCGDGGRDEASLDGYRGGLAAAAWRLRNSQIAVRSLTASGSVSGEFLPRGSETSDDRMNRQQCR